MALGVASGSFDIPASLGTFDVTGLGFQPKVLLLVNSDTGAFGAAAGMDFNLGAAESSTERFTIWNDSDDSAGTTACQRRYLTSFVIRKEAGNDYSVDFDSFLADGFRLDVDNIPGSTRKTAYLALGGSDISNVAVGSFTAPSSSGNDAVTGVGFQPDLVLFLSNLNGSNSLVSHNVVGIGAATGASNQWATNSSGIDGRTSMDADRYQRTNRCMTQAFNKSVSWEADLVSMDADGFTINYSASTGGDVIHYIALKGDFQANVFSWNETATSGTSVSQSVTGVGFEPAALLSAGFGLPANTAIQDDYSFQVGFTTGAASEFSFNATDEDGVGTTNNHQAFRDNRFYEALGVNSNATVSDAELTSFDSDGFTVNWLNTDGGQDQILGLAIGAAGGGGTTVTGSATLNGTGAVTASGIVTLVGAAALAGVGTLTADAAVAHTGDATLDGQGTLTAQGFLLQRSDATLDGVGTLSVDSNVTLGGIAALDGEGTLSAVPTLTLRTSAALDGVGTLTADGTIGGAITGQATLDGIGTLSVSAAVGHAGSALLDGQGALAAVPSLTLRSDSTLDGTGAISVTPTLTLGGDAALDGEGTLTADPRLVLRTTATLDGVGGLNATPFFDDLRSRESGWNQFVLDSDGRNSFTVTSGTPNQFEVD